MVNEKSTILLRLIDNGYSLKEIIKYLNINEEEGYSLFRGLHLFGFKFDREYTSDGDIYYKIKDDRVHNDMDREIIDNSDELDIIITSDTHFGSRVEDYGLMDMVMEFCDKESICLNIHGGDFVYGVMRLKDGTVGKETKYLDDLELLQDVIKKYPMGLLNFVCLGNHDIAPLLYKGRDVGDYFLKYRHDIIPIGYAKGIIKIQEERICIKHEIDLRKTPFRGYNFTSVKLDNKGKEKIRIIGHTHNYQVFFDDNRQNLTIYAPSLSNCKSNDTVKAIKAKLLFDKGRIKEIILTPMVFDKKITLLKEERYSFDDKINVGKKRVLKNTEND